MARRFLARLGLSPRNCGNCKAFDLKEGARIIQSRAVFHEVTHHVSPAQMMRARQIEQAAKEAESRKATLSEVDAKVAAAVDPEFPPAKPDVPELPEAMLDIKWSEFGRCLTHKRLDHQSNTCPEWS